MKELEDVDESKYVTTRKQNKVSSDMKIVVDGCQIIIITYPTFRIGKVSDQMKPYIKAGMNILAILGTGGAEFAFRGAWRNKNMEGLILNSGQGFRMGIFTSEYPKCMTEISLNETIFSR